MSYPTDENEAFSIHAAPQVCAERKLPWWIVKSRRRLGNGMTTVVPFWRPVHLRNLWSRFYFWTLVLRGF